MGHVKSMLVIYILIFMLLEGQLVCAIGTNLQTQPSSSSSETVLFKARRGNNFNEMGNINFRRRRFHHNHGFKGQADSEEQKRITPNGANPLHNR